MRIKLFPLIKKQKINPPPKTPANWTVINVKFIPHFFFLSFQTNVHTNWELYFIYIAYIYIVFYAICRKHMSHPQ